VPRSRTLGACGTDRVGGFLEISTSFRRAPPDLRSVRRGRRWRRLSRL